MPSIINTVWETYITPLYLYFLVQVGMGKTSSKVSSQVSASVTLRATHLVQQRPPPHPASFTDVCATGLA